MAADVTNELIFDTMMRVRDDVQRTDRKVDDSLTEIRGLKGHQAGFMRSELAQDSRIADIPSRLDRVEKRLDLREAE